MRNLLTLIFLLFDLTLSGQKITISGYVRDADTGENLIGATIQEGKNRYGSTTNVYGFYSLTLNSDSVSLIYSYVGYYRQTIHFPLRQDTLILVRMHNAMMLNEVVVSADRTDKIQESSRMSTVTIPIDQIKRLPR